jgi:uncharacterized protein (DUF952 family)
MILHIARREQWEQERAAGAYRGATLDTEGFIHCSEPQQIVGSANRFYPGQEGLVLLCINPDLVHSEVRYEVAGDGQAYPHIYGPLNPDAVTRVVDFPPGADGRFTLPSVLSA